MPLESQLLVGDALNPPALLGLDGPPCETCGGSGYYHHENVQYDCACFDQMDLKPVKWANLTLGSPPYTNRRTYGRDDCMKKAVDWVPWMLDVTRANIAVTKGPVMWVVNGNVSKGRYQPAVEGLIWEAYKAGIRCEHPLIWSKNATPNRKDWWCNGHEYIVAFLPDDFKVRFNWERIATEQKFARGGVFRQRAVDGTRKIGKSVVRSKLARPYDTIRASVGGGHMGSPLAHQQEAPYPESLVEPIILALTEPGDVVFDPFSGSGTTVAVANRLGRVGIGMDIRENQKTLATQRTGVGLVETNS